MKQTQKHIVIDARTRLSSTGRYIDRLIEHLQIIDTQNRYTILLRPDDTWKPSSKKFKTLVCRYRQFSFNILDQINFAVFLKKLNPDLVHFGMAPQEPLFYGGKRVTTLHDLTMLRFARAGRLPRWLHFIRMTGYRILLRLSLKKAARIIVPTEFVKQDVLKYLPINSRKVITTLEAAEAPLKADAVKPGQVSDSFILYVGSAFPHKNLERFVQAFNIVQEKHPELHLILVGKKELYYKQLERFAKNSINGAHITFTGFIEEESLKWLYEHAQAYVFPSLSEGFGLPGLEAMVHGCPVVSSNATCLPEVYGDAAHYFDPLDVQDMETKINEVLNDESLRSQLIANGYQQIKKYSWSRMAQQTLSIYTEVLNDQPS